MTQLHGFELVRETEIPELNTVARLYRHMKTGTELLSMINDDENKVFGITLFTPPPDSTGLPHIMEHSVLQGSRKYPVKQPFLELVKGSLQTFINAFTFPDKTVYPVASTNVQDFYNLVDVYMDAVFYPNITPQVLQQEGWHYELESTDDRLKFKGVVFNEMKGAYSSPDSLMGRYAQRSLFPDNPYRNDSGGDPRVIPDLTYEQFLSFYKTYYHPSNARLWFYGDDEPEERLRIANEVLQEFEPLEDTPELTVQAPFDEPVRLTIPYDSSEDSNKALVTLNWVVGESLDPENLFACDILSEALLGMPGSPLRKALIESGLGEDLMGHGLSAGLRQMSFSTGLRGVDPQNVDKVEQLILATLREIAEQGIEEDDIAAAMNTIEFQLRENNTGSFPRGLALLLSSLYTWLYGGDPLALLAFEAPLQAVKDQIEHDDRFFEKLIEKLLLHNPHRSMVVLMPDPAENERRQAEETSRLEQAQHGMSQADLEAIVQSTIELRRLQQTPNSPEALATIPRLTLDDLEREIKTVPLTVADAHGATVVYHDLFTNGIVYLDVGFDLHTLPQEYLPYVSLFGQALLEMGTETQDFVQLSQRIGINTGGIHPTRFVATRQDNAGEAAWFLLRAKAMPEQADALLAILNDVLTTTVLDNQSRFLQIVLEAKASAEARLVPMGHLVTRSRLSSHFTPSGWINEQMGGIENLFFLRALAEQIQADWPSVLATLEDLRNRLINRQAMICNITVDADNWRQFEPRLSEFVGGLPAAAPQLQTWQPTVPPRHEGLTIPAQVNYVGKGANLYELGYEYHGSAAVVNKHLSLAYLFETVRVQGGAYGGFSTFDRLSGLFAYLSYRDPNLTETLANYDAAVDYLRHLDLDQDEITRAIIGAISDIDDYELPDAKGYSSMQRYLLGITDAMRQQQRDEVLGTTLNDFHRFAAAIEPVIREGHVVVLGSAQAIAQAIAENAATMTVTKVL